MNKETKPVEPKEIPAPVKNPDIDPDNIPESPFIPEENPDIIPDEDPYENAPSEIPPPGERP